MNIKHKKIKIEPRIKLNYNKCTADSSSPTDLPTP